MESPNLGDIIDSKVDLFLNGPENESAQEAANDVAGDEALEKDMAIARSL